MKGLAIGTSCILAGSFAQAGSVQVAGSAGYASEWTLAGEVIQKGGAQQYAGPVTFTHAGLCTVSGPPVKSSEIRFEISGSGSSSKIQATILYEGTWCEYNGKLSGLSSHGSCGVLELIKSRSLLRSNDAPKKSPDPLGERTRNRKRPRK